ncbi:MAG: hypothetical protein RBR74_09120 [Ignavibacteriaceae bacterium]|jgi:hypothetical protein|nr:hypothetical protein [Ignavibacteriaceae bacterium]
MINHNLIDKTIEYYKKYSIEDYVVKPGLPILYFGDLEAYKKSELKIITVGKNPSNNEFKLHTADNYSFCRFLNWDDKKQNLCEVLNSYFESEPLKQWFSSFEPILNGASSSYYNRKEYPNRALHTDICTPLATHPTWSKLENYQRNLLFSKGNELWIELIEELQPDLMLISIPKELFKKSITSEGKLLITFDKNKDGSKKKFPYRVDLHTHQLKSGKKVKVIFGKAANKPFDTITNEQKKVLGELCRK